MVNDYKRYAINAFLTENYSKDEFKRRYSNKYKELVEKALYADQGWYKLRKLLREKTNKSFESVKNHLPFSIRKAAV